MKTIEFVQAQTEAVRAQMSILKQEEKKQMKKLNGELSFLLSIDLYLQSRPNEESLREQLARMEAKLEKINERKNFNTWCNMHIGEDNLLSKYNAEMGVGRIKAQIETLKYILD